MTFVRTPPPKASPASPSRASDDRALEVDHLATANDEALDELAALFLTPSQHQSKTAQPAATSKPFVELIIPGHLPVRGNLWLTPFADAIAREIGGCGLLRMDAEDEFSVQAIRTEVNDVDSHAALPDVLKRMSPCSRHWMIRPAMPLDLHAIVAAEADRLTILTGTDGISVVAAYQLIKDIAAAVDEAGVCMPRLAVAVVGAELDAGREMLRRLNVTASSFLDSDIELRCCLTRLDASARCSQHVTFSGEPCPSLADVVSWIRQPNMSAHVPGSKPAVPQQAADVDPGAQDAMHTDFSPNNGERTIATSPFKLSPKPIESRAVHQGEADKESHDAAAGAMQTAAAPALTEHIAGLKALSPRCPGHEMIELAMDGDGRLHLVGRDADLRHLHVVSAWAKTNRALLAMACNGELHADAQPICHVVTQTPADVADLHGADYRLHVLAPVRVHGHTGWYAAPLN